MRASRIVTAMAATTQTTTAQPSPATQMPGRLGLAVHDHRDQPDQRRGDADARPPGAASSRSSAAPIGSAGGP